MLTTTPAALQCCRPEAVSCEHVSSLPHSHFKPNLISPEPCILSHLHNQSYPFWMPTSPVFLWKITFWAVGVIGSHAPFSWNPASYRTSHGPIGGSPGAPLGIWWSLLRHVKVSERPSRGGKDPGPMEILLRAPGVPQTPADPGRS